MIPRFFFSQLRLSLSLVLLVAVLVLAAACTDYARNYRPPVLEAGTFRSRALLDAARRREFDKFFLEALRQKHKGNADAAYELLEHALAIHPNASEALFEQGRLLVASAADTDSALLARADALLLKAYQNEPKNPHIRRHLAEHWAAGGKHARAARLYEEIVADDPSAENLDQLMREQLLSNNYTAALATVDRWERVEGDARTAGLRRFGIYDAMGNKTRAYQSLRLLCEQHPADLRLRVLLGDLFLKHRYNEAAWAVINDVLTTDPDNADAQMSLVQYYLQEGQQEAFERQFSKIMSHPDIDPDRKARLLQAMVGAALEGKVDKLMVYERFREALAFPQPDRNLAVMALYFSQAAQLPDDSLAMPLRALLRDNPDELNTRVSLMQLAIRHEDTAALRDLAQKGTQLHPDFVAFNYYYALTLLHDQRDDAAIEQLETATHHLDARADSALASTIYGALGDLYHQRGDKTEAYDAYARALQYNAANVEVLNNYAYFLAQDGRDLARAEQMGARVVELAPDEPTFLDTYAWVLYRQRRFRAARTYIDKTLDLLEEGGMPTAKDAGLYDHAGDIYLRCGKRREAVEFWTTALELTADADLTQQLRRKIRRHRR